MTEESAEAEPGEDGDGAAVLVATGSEIAGGVAAAAVGLLFGPPGAIAGAVTGPLLVRGSVKRILGDFASRRLSHREEVRVGCCLRICHSGNSRSHPSGQTDSD